MRFLKSSTAKDSKRIKHSFIILENFMLVNVTKLEIKNPGNGSINS
jgi:hypothetical protein